MKKLVLAFLMVVSFASAQNDTMKLTATIANRNSDTLTVYGRQGVVKMLIADKSGKFSETFPVTAGLHQLHDGSEVTFVYLKPGYDLNLTLDAKQFDETIVYKGKGEKENNFLAKKMLTDEQFEEKMASVTDDAAFDAALAERAKAFETQLADASYDADFKTLATMMIIGEGKQMKAGFQQAKTIKGLTGKVSPSFDYENHKGGKTKLEDLRGKYVYIDNWATWCGPCRAEIPHLKKIEEKYHGKNIEFVSISIDTKKDYEKWKKFVADKQLGGVQLFADNDWNSQFMKDYAVQSIPRFILIGPDGKVIDADAKRPSDPALVAQLDALVK